MVGNILLGMCEKPVKRGLGMLEKAASIFSAGWMGVVEGDDDDGEAEVLEVGRVL